MRVAIIINSLKGYGVQKTALELAKSLVKIEGNIIDLIVINGEQEIPSELDEINVLFTGTKTISESGGYISEYLKRNEPNLLYTPLLHYGAYLLFYIKLKLKVPLKTVVSAANDILGSRNKLRTWRVYFLAKMVYRKADRVIALNKKMADDFVGKFKVNPRKVITINNPVFNECILDLAQEPVDHPFFEDSNNKIVIGVGRLSAQKDFITLIESVNLIDDESIRLIILGEGWRPELEAKTASLGLKDRVSLPGFVDNPYKYISKAKVFVLSSIWEGFGNVVVEALACGVNVVSTDCPSGPSEILDDGRYGILVPMKDPAKMASAIGESFSKEPDRAKLIERAREFEVSKVCDKYNSVFKELI